MSPGLLIKKQNVTGSAILQYGGYYGGRMALIGYVILSCPNLKINDTTEKCQENAMVPHFWIP